MVIDVGLQYPSEEEFVQGSLRPLRYDWYSTEHHQVLVTRSFHDPRNEYNVVFGRNTELSPTKSPPVMSETDAEVVLLYHAGANGGLGPSTRGHKGKSRSDHIRYRAHATTPAGSAKGWTKSDNGRDAVVRAMALLGSIQK